MPVIGCVEIASSVWRSHKKKVRKDKELNVSILSLPLNKCIIAFTLNDLSLFCAREALSAPQLAEMTGSQANNTTTAAPVHRPSAL